MSYDIEGVHIEYCSFCGAHSESVKCLVVGDSCSICDTCIESAAIAAEEHLTKVRRIEHTTKEKI